MAEVNNEIRMKYLRQQVENATAIQRVIMLFDACVRFLTEAKDALAHGDKAQFCEKVIRGKDIIRELRNSLNIDIDPMIGGNMYRLYTYFLKRLNDTHRAKNSTDVEFVIRQMEILNNSWKEVDRQGLAKDVKRYEERLGADDVNIIRRIKPNVSPFATSVSQNRGDSLLTTLNMRA